MPTIQEFQFVASVIVGKGRHLNFLWKQFSKFLGKWVITFIMAVQLLFQTYEICLHLHWWQWLKFHLNSLKYTLSTMMSWISSDPFEWVVPNDHIILKAYSKTETWNGPLSCQMKHFTTSLLPVNLWLIQICCMQWMRKDHLWDQWFQRVHGHHHPQKHPLFSMGAASVFQTMGHLEGYGPLELSYKILCHVLCFASLIGSAYHVRNARSL